MAANAARIVGARIELPFQSVDDVWRRSEVTSEAPVQLAEADAFRPAFGLERRNALWAIKALRDELLPLFVVAAERETKALRSNRSRRSCFGR